jgi:hypothetical protein
MDHRPNYLLQPDERCRKLHLKRLLKEQHLLYKYTMRHQQAIRRRNDETVVQESLLKLKAYQETVSNPRVLLDPFICRICNDDGMYLEMRKARMFIERFYGQLQNSVMSSFSTATNESKDHRLKVARTLLRHMTKGTQELRQFDDLEALLGYTRHKFIERALLVVSSLHHLCFEFPSTFVSDDVMGEDLNTRVSVNTATVFIQRLRQIRSVTSIGCGPGGDAVGVVAWLQAIRHATKLHDVQDGGDTDETSRENLHVLEDIHLLDWAMKQWHPIVSWVRDLLTYHYHLVQRVRLDSCDVRHSLPDQQTNDENENWADSSDLIVVVSYLFSETRNAWYPFFDDYVAQCLIGTLFLLTDPTAWQLHMFRERYEYCNCTVNGKRRCMEFMWLDSSMYRPELQELEGRNGPAVLLVMKVDNPTRGESRSCFNSNP